ncbi:hypothetical protein ACOSQ2_005119 [Xanthoceras sorbifolium]
MSEAIFLELGQVLGFVHCGLGIKVDNGALSNKILELGLTKDKGLLGVKLNISTRVYEADSSGKLNVIGSHWKKRAHECMQVDMSDGRKDLRGKIAGFIFSLLDDNTRKKSKNLSLDVEVSYDKSA